MERAVRAGGREILRYGARRLLVSTKLTNADFVTDADRASNRAMISLLKSSGKYGILSEETGFRPGPSGTFVIDPLDGTNNYVIGLPMVTCASALVVDNQTVAAAFYNPISRELFSATLRGGAYRNGKRLKVKGVTDIRRATLSTQQGYDSPMQHEADVTMAARRAGARRVLATWSPHVDYGLLAQGRIEGIIAREMQPYDYLGALLLAQEAGALVKFLRPAGDLLRGRPDFIVASSQPLLHRLRRVIFW